MSDTAHRRRSISRALLMTLLLTLVLPLGNLRQSAQAAPLGNVSAPSQPLAPNADPTSITLAGNLQSEINNACGDWNPACAATHLVNRGNGIWSATFSVPAGNWEYKMVINDDWNNGSYAGNHVSGGGNTTLTLAATTNVTFYYDHKTNAVLDSVMDKVVTAPGNYQSEIGCPGDWQPDCLLSLLTDQNGDGIYEFTTTNTVVGSYEFKVAINLGWAENYGVGGVLDGPNLSFNIVANGQRVTFKWNSTTKVPSVELEALQSGNDNNVEYNGLKHDSRDSLYRTPFGAVKIGTPVTLRLRTFHNDVTSVKTRFYNTATSSQFLVNMTPAATNVNCYDASLPSVKTCDYWTTTITPTERTVVYYRFIVMDGTATAYYEDDNRFDGGLGEAVASTSDRSYNIYVYEPNFTTPDWARNATIYQIFVERFRNGDTLNDPTGVPTDTYATEPNVPTRGWFYPQERGRRFPITPWNSIVPDPEPFSDLNNPWRLTYSSTMYGGDLQGVTQKINDNYFTNLGVTALYLNPIFDSPSNHKYDGRDYRKVDPAFGGEPAWDALVVAAKAKGLKIILDGVPNHVSSDSPYFDRFGRWPEVGACESVNSPYRSWFFFVPITSPDQPVCDGNVTYRAWFGVQTLPQINTAHPQVMDFWFGNNGTANYWIDNGADGWRIDVVPDIVGVNPTFFKTWRSIMKAAHPNAVLYSETWPEGDVRDRVLGDEFDSTMNYRYRRAVLGFMRDTNWSDNDGGQEVDALAPSQFVNAFETMREDYPKPAFDAAMNLIDSHDTNRAVHVLNEKGFTGSGKDRQPVDNFVDAKRRLGMVAILQMTLPGAPTIYYGDEVGLTGYGFDIPRDDPYNRQPYPWADEDGYSDLDPWRQADAALKATYTTASNLRRQYTFLRTGSFDVMNANDANRTLAYGRRDSTGAAIVVFNRSNTTQNVALNLRGYVPTGSTLARVMPVTQTGSLAATTATTYTFSVNANSYGIWVTPTGADMTAPVTPTNLMATAGNAQVMLKWTASAGATSYNVYRSFVTGGGYQLIGNSATTAYTDTMVMNGNRYFYVVKAVDNVGNESAASNEASATPSFPIGYAVLQFPKEVTVTLGITPTSTIYGQIYAAGLTDAGGNEAKIIAQIGYGAVGSSPTTWMTWRAMSFNVRSGNNYEYQGVIYPKMVGTFDMLVRFSTDGGLTWSYGDKDGFFPGEPGTDNPGKLYVLPNSDTTAPAAPQNLRVTGWSDDYIALKWDPVADAALYRVYRSTITNTFNFASPLAEVMAPTTMFTDTTVTSNVRYYYVVKAVDAALNESPASNEVSQKAEPQLVEVTFRVTVPAGTPGEIYIAGNTAKAFCDQQWNPGACKLTRINATTWEHKVTLLDGTALEYKYTRGSWDTVEKQADGNAEINNRMVTIDYGTTGKQTVNDTVANWRDPFVIAYGPKANTAMVSATTTISVTWNQAMRPETDFMVMGPNGVVSGTFALSNNDTVLTFTPNAPLADGKYTVTVSGEVDPNNDVQQVATVWSFYVGKMKIYLPIIKRNS